jgi:predicted metal-dependent RNase
VGRALAEGEKQIELFGELFERKADVVVLSGFSAHAGQEMLLEYALAAKDSLEQVFLVHGEERQAQILQEKLKEAGMRICVYTINDPRDAARLEQLGVDGIFTDYPNLMVKQYDKSHSLQPNG